MALVRLRSRPRSGSVADWAQPPAGRGGTRVGNLDSSQRASVDPAGLVTIDGRGWSLDWWIGAEDRWHLPGREAAVRQSLVGQSPVVETRVRIPSGDAVQRVYAALGPAGEDVLVVEVTNESKVPFALALAVRPHAADRPGRVGSLALDGTLVRIDDAPAMRAARAPGRMALSTAATGDSLMTVLEGAATPARSDLVSCPDGLASGAFLFPLAHTATLRVALPLDGSGAVEPSVLPDPHQVASGWAAQTRRAATFEVPDRRLREALAASTRHLLLAATSPAEISALDLLGLADEARVALTADPVGLARTGVPGAALHALGWHWALTRDVATARTVVPTVAALLTALPRTVDALDSARGHAALGLVADLLDAAGESTAASDVGTLVGTSTPAESVDGALDWAEHLASASPTWTWAGPSTGHDLGANAALVTAVRQALVGEVASGLALSPSVPAAWLGQGWEVHDAPTAHGRLSYAVRWHGERPALLWELDLHPGRAAPRLTMPGLDPSWSSRSAEGEALLAPVAVPVRPSGRRGLSLPVTIEPMPRREP